MVVAGLLCESARGRTLGEVSDTLAAAAADRDAPLVGVPFSDLVNAREHDKRYRDLRALFERDHGLIEEEFWGTARPMGLVLTAVRPSAVRRRLGLPARFSLHRSTEYACLPSKIETALGAGDLVAAKVEGVLSGRAAQTVLVKVFAAQKSLLTAIRR